MAGKKITQINLTAWQFAQHTGVTIGKVLSALKANGIETPQGQSYSLRDLVRSMMGESGLKKQAEDARYQGQIDQAQIARDKVLENKRVLVKRSEWEDMFSDLQIKLIQIIKHTKLSDQEKELAIREIREAKVGE